MLNDASPMVFIATKEPSAAKAFYRDTLGLRLISDEQYAIVFESNGIMLRIQKAQEFSPAAFTVLGWEVKEIHAAIESLIQQGVIFEKYPHLTQDASGVHTFQDGTMVAWFKDPDGNLLSLTQFN